MALKIETGARRVQKPPQKRHVRQSGARKVRELPEDAVYEAPPPAVVTEYGNAGDALAEMKKPG
jgi:hypothetical protein